MTEERLPLPHRGRSRRFLSVSLPLFPSDRLHRRMLGKDWRSRTEGGVTGLPPLAIVAKVKSALRITALDEHAARLGLRTGMPLADARAMIPELGAADDDPAADAALMDEVAAWAERYTPLVAIDAHAAHGLTLDITGAAHLFGGEAAMVADLVRRLTEQSFASRAAIADNPGAASAAARFTTTAVVTPGENRALLTPLPLAALRLPGDTVFAMERVGLKKIGQIIDAPRAPLATRFGAGLITRLDQALGFLEESINPRRRAPTFIAERRFAEPISREDDIAATLSSLADTLGTTLERHGEGARHLVFTLYRVDGVVTEIAVGAARPIRTPRLILDLFREKFAALGEDGIDAGFGFDMARLAVTATAPADAEQGDFSGDAISDGDLDGLIDRIGARLGPGSVGLIAARESHIPERAETLVRPDTESKGKIAAASSNRMRPLRLFAHPEPVDATAEVPDGPPIHFRWRRASYRVVRAEGPERIAPEWWREDAFTRDYFRVEDSDGHRFWLYREGLYGREINTPRWYLHGVFA